ncbi:putative tetratricopeptide-like helical domain superfamily [Helianthus annuus]|nr:putative tetratricopeptide-like helical domain superfamily [Helianthus annuus]
MPIILIPIILITIIIFIYLLITKNLIKTFRYKHLPCYDAKHHFINGAQFLSKSRSTSDRTIAIKLAKQAADEADRSIALDPNDAASHVLKALALDAQGYTTSALTALDVALSPLTAKSLSDAERGEALFKRAEIKKVSCCKEEERVDSVFEDLVESVKLYGENAEAFWMLGECYEKKGRREEAVRAYEKAVRIDPVCGARDALKRLGSGLVLDIETPPARE